MNSSLVDFDNKKETIKYPCLRENILSGRIFLFTARNKATLVYDPAGSDSLGIYFDNLNSANEEAIWTTPTKGVLLEP